MINLTSGNRTRIPFGAPGYNNNFESSLYQPSNSRSIFDRHQDGTQQEQQTEQEDNQLSAVVSQDSVQQEDLVNVPEDDQDWSYWVDDDVTEEDREEPGSREVQEEELTGEELLGAVGGAPPPGFEPQAPSSRKEAYPAETISKAPILDEQITQDATCPWEGTVIFDLDDPLDNAIVSSTPGLLSSYEADLALLEWPQSPALLDRPLSPPLVQLQEPLIPLPMDSPLLPIVPQELPLSQASADLARFHQQGQSDTEEGVPDLRIDIPVLSQPDAGFATVQAEREVPGLGSPPQIQLDFVAEDSDEEVPELVVEVHTITLPDTGFAVGQEGVVEAGRGSPPQAQVDVISFVDS